MESSGGHHTHALHVESRTAIWQKGRMAEIQLSTAPSTRIHRSHTALVFPIMCAHFGVTLASTIRYISEFPQSEQYFLRARVPHTTLSEKIFGAFTKSTDAPFSNRYNLQFTSYTFPLSSASAGWVIFNNRPSRNK